MGRRLDGPWINRRLLHLLGRYVEVEQEIAATLGLAGIGVENVEPLGEDEYRLKLDTPVGKLEPGVRITERAENNIRWAYTSTVEGGGRVEVEPDGEGCMIRYTGEFRLKSKILGRAAKLAGMERFARKNGERSLTRLKALMEAGRYQ